MLSKGKECATLGLVFSGAGEFYPEAMEWFDKMQSRLSLSQNYLLAIISRIFLGKVEGSY